MLFEDGYIIRLNRKLCSGKMDGVLKFGGHMVKGVYNVNAVVLQPCIESAAVSRSENTSISQEEVRLWHHRLGYTNTSSIKRLFSTNSVTFKHADYKS